MLTFQTVLVAIIAIIVYRAFTAWQKSFNNIFKATKLPADPPWKEGPSPAKVYRGCAFGFVQLILMLIAVYWVFWIFSGS